MYNDIIRRSGGYALYQKITTLIVISQFSLYYSQFFSLNFLLLVHPKDDYECIYEGKDDEYVPCTKDEVCSDDVVSYKFVYNETENRESFPNWYESMSLTCIDRAKVNMIPISYVIGNIVSFLTSTMQIKAFGMKNVMLFMTGVQVILTTLLLWVTNVDSLICISCLLGLTGSR